MGSITSTRVRYSSAVVGMVASWIIGAAIIVIKAPWSEALGYADAPARIMVIYLASIFVWLIPALIATYLSTRNPKWLAPPGKYVAGAKYKVFSPRTLTAIAILIALYAVSGLPTGVNIDVPAIVASFASVFYGPLVVFVTFIVGAPFRWLIGGMPWALPALVPFFGMLDASIWALGSYIYWYFLRDGKFTGRKRTIAKVLCVVAMIAIHYFGWGIYSQILRNPWPASLLGIIRVITTWYPTCVAFVIIGAVIGEEAYKARALER